MDPVAPRSGRRRRRIARALIALVLILVVAPLACVELAYQIEIARIPERPESPAPSFAPLVVRAAAVHLFDTPDPQMTPIYPWTLLIAIGKARLAGALPRLTPEALAATQVLRTGNFAAGRSTIDNTVLSIWISRHLSAREAICVALSKLPFGLQTSGIESAARLLGKSSADLDAGEVAQLLAMYRPRPLNMGISVREMRDGLLRKMHAQGVIDEATMQAAMEQDVRRFK